MYHGEENPYCCFHPKEKIVGVCARCLKERLLILLAKQRQQKPQHERRPSKISKLYKKPTNSLPKVFALSSLLHRLEIRSHKQHTLSCESDNSASNDDSFISIKFGDNGAASWDKGRHSTSWAPASIYEVPSKPSSGTDITVNKSCNMVEHGRSRTPKLRWRKRIGHILQLVRRRRSNKGNKVEIKGKRGWIKPITKRNITVGE